MTDDRTQTEYTLGQLAEVTSGRILGDPETPIHEAATLEGAGPGAISFLANPRYRPQLATTAASAVILEAAEIPTDPAPPPSYLVCADPYLAFARIARHLNPRRLPSAGVSPTASIASSARLGSDVSIGHGAVVEAEAVLGDNAAIGANSVVGEGAIIGARTELRANVVVEWGCVLGDDGLVQSGSVIGGDGFGIAPGDEGWEKIPQLGRVSIGDGVEIGACCCVDRAASGETVVEEGVKLDNYVQIGHNVRLGAHTVMAAKSGISGSTRLGPWCRVAGGVGIGGHLTIAGGTVLTAMSMITHDIDEPGMYSSGTPMSPTREWRRNAVRFNQLDRMARQIRWLEQRLDTGTQQEQGD